MSVEFEPRDYQQAQQDALYRWWNSTANTALPIIVSPTGSGKSFTIAKTVDNLWEAYGDEKPRTVVLVPSKELAEQNAEKLAAVLPANISIGFYSASLGRKNPHADVIVATIGSIYRDAHLLGAIRCVIIDECHLVNPDGDGRYRQFLDELALCTVFVGAGLTATPFRGNGVWLTEGESPLFTGICHETKITDLIDRGYLAPLALPEGGTKTRIDTESVTVRSGDYAIDELGHAVGASLPDVADEAVELAAERQRVIAFTPTVETAEMLCEELRDRLWTAEVVCGSTPKDLRARRIADFRAGRIRCLVTVLALATGFDVPDIDAIIWARPARSPVLYIQGAGRGLRAAPGKTDCLWLDFTDTTDRMGPIDEVQGRSKPKPTNSEAPYAICNNCKAKVVPASAKECPYCGAEMREEKSPFRAASESPILSSQRKSSIKSFSVDRVHYHRHQKPGSPDSIRVAYMSGMKMVAQEFVCPDHGNWSTHYAIKWIRTRAIDSAAGNQVVIASSITAAALEFAKSGGLRAPIRISVDTSKKYPKITAYEFADEKAIA